MPSRPSSRRWAFLVASSLVLAAGGPLRADPITVVEDGWEWFIDLFGLGASHSKHGSTAPAPRPVDLPPPESGGPSGGSTALGGAESDSFAVPGPPAGLPDCGLIGEGGPAGGGPMGGGGFGEESPPPAPEGPARYRPSFPIPEPSTLVLALGGLTCLTALSRRRPGS